MDILLHYSNSAFNLLSLVRYTISAIYNRVAGSRAKGDADRAQAETTKKILTNKNMKLN